MIVFLFSTHAGKKRRLKRDLNNLNKDNGADIRQAKTISTIKKKKNRRTVGQRTAEGKYLPNASITADKYWPIIVGHHALWDDAYSVDPVCNRNLVVHTRSVKSLDENEYFNTNY